MKRRSLCEVPDLNPCFHVRNVPAAASAIAAVATQPMNLNVGETVFMRLSCRMEDIARRTKEFADSLTDLSEVDRGHAHRISVAILTTLMNDPVMRQAWMTGMITPKVVSSGVAIATNFLTEMEERGNR